ncbi:MAG: bifunctional UDP-N-acetylglucosamine diphosphorylase/glucosamine-1-phosphate N-acetyltransferase GlmU [Alphaproteobacteria bacterium]|nr:bifunctional UDP-N-acetylglucosamine diphosphorylase/glucosamine-1-phosphate N-acetyltransferase GlmU [Alphaproteobacteria bacterium]
MYSVIILAAGNGSRLKTTTPKILHKIGSLSLLDHVIHTSNKLSPEKIVVVTKPDFDLHQIKYFENITTAFQQEQKGTGHAVQCGLSAFNNEDKSDWIFILYADIPLISPETLQEMLHTADKFNNTGVVVLAMDSNGTQNLGKLESAEQEGTIKAIVEAKDISNHSSKLLPLCNCGLLIKKSVLDQYISEIKPSKFSGEIYITEIVSIAYKHGYTCCYYKGDSKELSGANTLAEMAVLEHNFQNIMREKYMENGVKLIAPETVFFSYDTQIESDVIIQPYVVFGENVYLKKGAVVGPFCVIEGGEIRSANVGPFSRIRPESVICDGVKIGNFVEVKKSIISENTKINHLTYIGDSSIGKNTNIGAGTITCNYDGIHKHKTVIGNNVFIGSNSAIVAPVEIHDNVTVGAGSVITKDIQENTLAVARAIQKNIDNWSNKRKRK